MNNSLYTFYREFNIAKNHQQEWFGKKLSEDIIKKSENIKMVITETINQWYELQKMTKI